MPFTPGPGVGGHCIPIDPYYLLWKAREYDFYTRFIELAAETNEAMPYHVIHLVTEALSRLGRALNGARVLVLGVAFKPDISDARNSPAERVIELLLSRGADVAYHDPFVPSFSVGNNVFYKPACDLRSQPLTAKELQTYDVAAVITGHRSVDYVHVMNHIPLVVDTCNATQGLVGKGRIVKLGAPLSHIQE
jgi:UDP-N-acetyl-D-glucosamine dehydrogenase